MIKLTRVLGASLLRSILTKKPSVGRVRSEGFKSKRSTGLLSNGLFSISLGGDRKIILLINNWVILLV